jgi:hypothetical protein
MASDVDGPSSAARVHVTLSTPIGSLLTQPLENLMRILRSLATGVLLAATLLGAGASAVLAAPAETVRYDFGDTWCFDDVVYTYCSDSDAFLQVVITQDGTSRAVIHHTISTDITDASGAYVGSYTVRSQSISTYGDDRTASLDVEHVRSVGDLTCTSSTVLKIVDFELTLDRQTAHCV